MLEKVINLNILKEPYNWVIVPLVVIMAGLALSLVMGQAAPTPLPSSDRH